MTLHVVSDVEPHRMKERIRTLLLQDGIGHVTIELEHHGESCTEWNCHRSEGGRSISDG